MSLEVYYKLRTPQPVLRGACNMECISCSLRVHSSIYLSCLQYCVCSYYNVYQFYFFTVLLKQDMEHFSVLNFKKDPKTYIHESNRLSQDGETFEYAKDELLKMFASPDRRLTLATLAHLSCFNNDEVRLMALERLEKSLDEDTFDSDRHSAALSEAEEVLREFMLTPSHEPLAYWMHRYQVYGKVVTNFWLHKEKGYLYYDSKKTRALEKLIQDLSGMTDRLGSSDTSFVLRKYNALFTQFAVSRLTGKRDCCVDSGVWARVEQLGQAKLPLKKCPVMEVKHLDKDINNYFHLDVLLSVCSKKVYLCYNTRDFTLCSTFYLSMSLSLIVDKLQKKSNWLY